MPIRARRITFSFAAGITLAFVAISAVLAWTWQAHYYPFYHTNNTCGTVDAGGQEDAAVVYEGGERRVYAEGSYLKWSSSARQCLIDRQYFTPNQWGAIVFHAFNYNSANCNALRWKGSGWAWSNLPGVAPQGRSNDCELRFYIQSPRQISASLTYYASLAFKDTAYPGTKTVGEVPEAFYFVEVNSWFPTMRDDNAKLCIRADTAQSPSSGLC
jgi:hypothetical protein